MSGIDPFGLGSGADPFAAAPAPAARPEPGPTAFKPPAQGQLAPDLPDVVSGSNPLVAAANPLLNLAPQLRATAVQPDPAAVRDYLVSEVRQFEIRARQAGLPNEVIVGARYCLCTLLDEIAAQTPWGGSGMWSAHSLLVMFHNESWGGEKFFQLLSKLAQNPGQHRDLLELMYYCLAMGLEGRFRVIENGRQQLETVKQRLAQILITAKGEHARALSTHWTGVTSERKRPWEWIPVWVIAAGAVVVAFAAYVGFAHLLAGRSDLVYTALNGVRMARVIAPPPAAAPEAPRRLAQFLEPEVKAQLVTVQDLPDRSIVTLRGDGLFKPASEVVMDQYQPVLARIADALNGVPGTVLVTGYTDSVPIRTARFPSNWQLSQERADSVKQLLAQRLAVPTRVRAEGRADADPVAPNDTPANRARNRRVEITLFVAPKDTAKFLEKQ